MKILQAHIALKLPQGFEGTVEEALLYLIDNIPHTTVDKSHSLPHEVHTRLKLKASPENLYIQANASEHRPIHLRYIDPPDPDYPHTHYKIQEIAKALAMDQIFNQHGCTSFQMISVNHPLQSPDGTSISYPCREEQHLNVYNPTKPHIPIFIICTSKNCQNAWVKTTREITS